MTMHTSPMSNSVDIIKRTNSLRRTIDMYICKAIERERYWVCSREEYVALDNRLDRLGLRWGSLSYRIAERSATGAVRIVKI